MSCYAWGCANAVMTADKQCACGKGVTRSLELCKDVTGSVRSKGCVLACNSQHGLQHFIAQAQTKHIGDVLGNQGVVPLATMPPKL
jgi:hypothetical protein